MCDTVTFPYCQPPISSSPCSSFARMSPIRTTPSLTLANTPANTTHLYQLAQTYGGKYSRRFNRSLPYRDTTVRTIRSTPSYTIPTHILEHMNVIEGRASGEKTKRNDENRVRAYLKFCEGLGIRFEDAIPAPYDLVAAWISSFAGRYCGKTVGTKISAIKKVHENLGYPWNPGDRFRRMVKGIEQMRPPSSHRKKRAPLTIPMLLDINRGLQRSDPLDICVRCILLLCFFCQLRAGELLCPTNDLRKFDPTHHATFENVSESTSENGASNLHLPWSKTEKGRGDDVWIPRQERPLDPIHALHKHFLKNRLELHHPIASYRDVHGSVITLTRSRFIRRINEILYASGKSYPRITGHCARIGGTTFYLVSGVPPDMVKKFGRWRSNAFLDYWRCLDYLGALHLEMLPLEPGRLQRSHPRS
jgi:hypothetical protein